MAEQEQAGVDEQFRDNLRDVDAVVRKLAPLCRDVNDLLGMIGLALVNDGQLALLLREVAPVRLRK